MKGLLEQILNNDDAERPLFRQITTNLTSVTFAASWTDDFDSQAPIQACSDCILTLNYHSAIEDKNAWIKEARQVCSDLKLSQVHGRSRKLLLSAIPITVEDIGVSNTAVLRDTIWLSRNTNSGWKVSLSHPGQQDGDCIALHYQKPENAFFHPNAHVMCQALVWTLNRISSITSIDQHSTSCAPSWRLLELYSGCGAHTIAVAKARLVSSILAVELDARLVDACRANIILNQLHVHDEATGTTSPINIFQGDAGSWAKKQQRRKTTSMDDPKSQENCNILLVDPPRQGLDDQVINTAIHCDDLEHILIISCGHDALVRDLEVLSGSFEIVDCTQLDLFPRTESIETLVHLRKRRNIMNSNCSQQPYRVD